MALLVHMSEIIYASHKFPIDTKVLNKTSLQLPQCPLCIERLDVGISGLTALTSSDIIGCVYSHTARGWSACEGLCKVCKSLSPTNAPTGKTLSCPCGVKESIWACLICGYIGCGRYQQGHAAKHFLETNHCFAVDIDSGRIWHYLEDGYVHRILKSNNLAPIELHIDREPSPASATPGNPAELSVIAEDAIILRVGQDREHAEGIQSSAGGAVGGPEKLL